MTVTSPCTGVCKIDESTGWCLGCARTDSEIAIWQNLTPASRDLIWEKIPGRLAELGVVCRRLPWTTDDIRTFVSQTLGNGRGTWVMGVVGAAAEFTVPHGAPVNVTHDEGDVIAHTPNGAIRVAVSEGVRALTFDPPGLNREPRVALTVIREWTRVPRSSGVADLGADDRQLIQEPASRLFDLGLGRKEARFCVRVDQGLSHDALSASVGQPFEHALNRIGGPLLSESPTRVVETALGRIEVQGKIPPPNSETPSGPRTHLLPVQLATNRATPVGFDLPRAYWPGAIYYPQS